MEIDWKKVSIGVFIVLVGVGFMFIDELKSVGILLIGLGLGRII